MLHSCAKPPGLVLIPAKLHNVPVDFDGILAMLRKRRREKLRKVLLDEGEPRKPNTLTRDVKK